MSREMVIGMFAAWVVWVIASLIKAAKAVASDSPYRFGRWDGGTMRAGKSLTKKGTQIKSVFLSFVLFDVGSAEAGLVPHKLGLLAVTGIILANVVTDSLTTVRDDACA